MTAINDDDDDDDNGDDDDDRDNQRKSFPYWDVVCCMLMTMNATKYVSVDRPGSSVNNTNNTDSYYYYNTSYYESNDNDTTINRDAKNYSNQPKHVD